MSSSLDIISHYLNRANAAPPPPPPPPPQARPPPAPPRPRYNSSQLHHGHNPSVNRISTNVPSFVDVPPLCDPNEERLTTLERRDRIIEAANNADAPTLRSHLEALLWNENMQVTREEFRDETLGIGELIRRIWEEESMPSDVRVRAGRLYARWRDGVFTCDPTKRWAMAPTRDGRGDLGFIVGEVFLNRAALVTAGIHRASQAGIHGRSGEDGAFSIIISNSDYDDADKGQSLWYSGTRSKDGNISQGTQRLEEAFQSRAPIRVLRTEKAPWSYRPAYGIRYEGLYIIDDRARTSGGGFADYKYHLTRIEGQLPIQMTPLSRSYERRIVDHYKRGGL